MNNLYFNKTKVLVVLSRVGAIRVVEITFMPHQTLIIHRILLERILKNGYAG